jgi:signal transduction histidine kinase
VSDARERLTRLCRKQGLEIESSEDRVALDQVFDRALAACERELADKAASLDDRRERLRDLLQLARLARSIEPAPAPAVEVDQTVLNELFQSLSRLCHKINNPLTSIMGRAQMVQLQLRGADDKIGKSIDVIEESVKRVAGLVQELANLVCQGRKELVERYDSSRAAR